MLKEKMQNFVENNNFYVYTRNDKQHYILPYKSKKLNILLDIYVDIYEELNLMKFSFHSNIKCSPENNIDKIREELLDLNSKLIFGTLSLQSGSNIVEYSIDYYVNETHDISLEVFNNYVVYCLKLYSDLLSKQIIEAEKTLNE